MQLIPVSSVRKAFWFLSTLLAVAAIRRWLRSKGALWPDPREKRRSGGRVLTSAAGGGTSHGSSASRGFRQRAPSPPGAAFRGAATEAELGPRWHFDGARRWQWLHDGRSENGWIELGAGGALKTSFGSKGSNSWEMLSSGELVVTFGRCHHICELLPARGNEAPMFVVKERKMKDGSAARPQRGPSTRGRLERRSAPYGQSGADDSTKSSYGGDFKEGYRKSTGHTTPARAAQAHPPSGPDPWQENQNDPWAKWAKQDPAADVTAASSAQVQESDATALGKASLDSALHPAAESDATALNDTVAAESGPSQAQDDAPGMA
eukprot:TRINITY_DN24241_c0_g1_i1.p1 TRINITY_DN24241_c0_g1~~TRINITY_DN24241_c0_g1_i1.p1  ORF type:complete len:321 (-),score=46.92 TRINITY_DN24241_c0_g1_i1:117-1079(-)